MLGGHADPVDPQQAGVEDDAGLAAGHLDGLGQGWGHRGEQVQRRAQVAVDRRGTDVEAGRQVGVGLALAQVRRHEQSLLSRV